MSSTTGETMDRRELARQYKESRRPMGVWCVRNTANGKVLIGTSVDLPAMLNRQQAQLRFGAHANRDLQRDWETFGPAAFRFEVLDTLPPHEPPERDPADDLRVLEALWLERLAPYDERGYHAAPRIAG